MIRTSRSCSWCHAMNSQDDPAARNCRECGHRSDIPRSECDCPQCKGPRPPLTAADVEEALKYLAEN